MNEISTHKEMLKDSGLKNTKHRNSILSIFEKNAQPLTAEQIYAELANQNTSINLSTIYRILKTLTEKELIIKTTIKGDSKALFELNNNEHRHHLVCIECKEITMVDECPFEEYEKKLKEKMGFTILDHKLEIYGVCNHCQEKADEKNKTEIDQPSKG